MRVIIIFCPLSIVTNGRARGHRIKRLIKNCLHSVWSNFDECAGVFFFFSDSKVDFAESPIDSF